MRASRELFLALYTKMVQVRAFEDRAAQEFAAGRLPGFVHLYAGEEAVAVGVCAQLREDDFITSTHRGHGHCIAKGCDIKGMMAELYGKATGLCKGKGGSMHIADISLGMLGANGIVGAGPPLACGSALSAKIRGSDQVTACFFGDGASNQGTFHESLNLAAIWELPVVFVAENNHYAQSAPWEYHQKIARIAERAASYGMPGVSVDGSDVLAVYEAAGEAVARARAGGGPTLLECETDRFYGHFQGEAGGYRSKEEIEHLKKEADPILKFRKRVLEEGLLSSGELAQVDRAAAQLVEEAVAFARESAYPEPEETLRDVYVRY